MLKSIKKRTDDCQRTEFSFIRTEYCISALDYLVHAMAIKNSIVGVFGMLVSVVAGAVLDFIQKNGNQIFGIHLYGQQFLAGLSLCLTLIAVGYARHIPKREKNRKCVIVELNINEGSLYDKYR